MKGAAALLVRGLTLLAVAACARVDEAPPAPAVEWAIAVHGGVWGLPASLDDADRERYRAGLEGALRAGATVLEDGGRAVDAVDRAVRFLEDDPQFNAGRGAVFHREGGHELDAAIMDGRTLACGAVAGVRTIKNPIALARRVMEHGEHVLLAGDGAERFADLSSDIERVDPDYFSTERRRRQLERHLAERAGESGGSTVGAVARDRHGDLAAATSTGGLTGKRPGRIGDVPVIGAGTLADNRSCAVSCTGKGEEFIRHGVARTLALAVESGGTGLAEAAGAIVERTLRPGDGGLIAVDRTGRIAIAFNTEGMFRGVADSSGRFVVAIGPQNSVDRTP
jgi:beta-aspartyl-peptidase (threonine type)